MKRLRVMLLVHAELAPPETTLDDEDPLLDKIRTEYDVRNALVDLGHDVMVVPVEEDLAPVRLTHREWRPDIAFNLLEDFAGEPSLDYFVATYLQMLRVPYTGCNPRGLMLARDKALSKKLLSYHRIKVPDFVVVPFGKTIKKQKAVKLPYPMIVKSLVEEGSVGIAQASHVNDAVELEERVKQVHQMTQGDAIAEQYIDGRELYVTIIGNDRLQVLPIRELVFDNVREGSPRIATYKVKWDPKYRERWGIDYQFVRNLPAGMHEKIVRLAKRVYRILDLNGYARLDLRLTSEGRLFVLEANPNNAIASNDDSALSAEKAGITYPQFIQKLLSLALSAAKKS